MFKQKNIFLSAILILLVPQFFIATQESSPAKESSDIELNCSAMVDPDRNIVEQLIDLIYERKLADFWVWTPDRSVPLIQISHENGKIMYIHFEIPHRIDMDPKYSKQIHEEIKTRKEIPLAAFNEVREIDHDETVDVPMSKHWILYKMRLVNAGRYGYIICYDRREKNSDDVHCMTLEEFRECLNFYKPNQKKQNSE